MGSFEDLMKLTAGEKTAMAAGTDAPSSDNGQNYLSAPEGYTLTQDPSANTSRIGSLEAPVHNASLSGSGPSYSSPASRVGLSGTRPTAQSFAASRPEPKLTPDALMKQAKAMLAMQELQNSHAMAAGPATGTRNADGTKTPEWLTKYMNEGQ